MRVIAAFAFVLTAIASIAACVTDDPGDIVLARPAPPPGARDGAS